MMDEDQDKTPPTEDATKPQKAGAKKGSLIRRFPLIMVAVVLAGAMIGGSVVYAAKKRDETAKTGFDTSKVLPSVTIPPSSPDKEFTADTIKQYDGKDGNKCYAAVNGVVYEIDGKGQWQGGQHQPSSGKAYCGADMTEAIKQSPHGASKLEELPKVGTYKSE